MAQFHVESSIAVVIAKFLNQPEGLKADVASSANETHDAIERSKERKAEPE